MLNRRSFMKMCGVAAAAPLALAKADTRPIDSDSLEVEISFPSGIWNAETGKMRELDLSNPADAVLYMVGKTAHKGMGALSIDIDYDAFESWKYYCDEQNLKCAIITKGRSLIDCLCELAGRGHAFLYWDGEDGKLRVIYGSLEFVNTQAGRLGYQILDDTKFWTTHTKPHP